MTLTDIQRDLLEEARELTAVAYNRGAKPRVHPNGFIQLDLKTPESEEWHEGKQAGHSGADLRLHIWNPPGVELPHQDTVNEIHDHVFDMRSTVVKGMLIQRLYEFAPFQEEPFQPPADVPRIKPEPTHELYRAVYDKNSSSRLEPTGERGTLREIQQFPVHAGENYTQPAFTLHDTDAGTGLLVTLMEKTAVREGIPKVICPIGTSPDNDFDRATAAPQDILWEAIRRALA